jgi:3-phenylpropionate/cinnamic acid dioxygenase small subunit
MPVTDELIGRRSADVRPETTGLVRLNVVDAEKLLYSEARLLDQRRYSEWLQLYTTDSVYWMPCWASENQIASTAQQSLSLLNLDRKGLETFVKRLLTGEAHTYEPAGRTNHLLSNVMILDENGDGSEAKVSCKWMMQVYRRSVQEIFGGELDYVLRREGDSWKIAYKKVVVLNDWIERGQLLLV